MQMSDQLFNKAVQNLINGSIDELEEIIKSNPDIVHQRSSSNHGAQLIHYLGANGIENELQKSPTNAAQIAQLLLDSGADPNSPAYLYGDDAFVLDLLASSVHPCLAGVQPSLIKTLVNGGAKINGQHSDGSPLGLALGFGYTGVAEMLYQLGARVDNILYAAGLGLLELINERESDSAFLNYKSNNGDRVGAFTWPPPQLENPLINPLIYAAFHNRLEVVQYFLNKGINPNFCTKMHQTPLHFAAYMGHMDTVQLLIQSGANPSPMEDQWNSVPAGWAKGNGHTAVMEYLVSQTN